MKRTFYIVLFCLLGLIVSTLIHAAIELPTLTLITGNFEKYSDSFIWQNWRIIHGFVGAVIWIAGLVVGYWCGVKWWQILYVENVMVLQDGK